MTSKSVVKGFTAGLIGGLAAAWVIEPGVVTYNRGAEPHFTVSTN